MTTSKYRPTRRETQRADSSNRYTDISSTNYPSNMVAAAPTNAKSTDNLQLQNMIKIKNYTQQSRKSSLAKMEDPKLLPPIAVGGGSVQKLSKAGGPARSRNDSNKLQKGPGHQTGGDDHYYGGK